MNKPHGIRTPTEIVPTSRDGRAVIVGINHTGIARFFFGGEGGGREQKISQNLTAIERSPCSGHTMLPTTDVQAIYDIYDAYDKS